MKPLPPDEIVVGKKELGRYLLAILLKLREKGEVKVLGYGRYSSKAIHVADLLRSAGLETKIVPHQRLVEDSSGKKILIPGIEIRITKSK